MIVANFTPDDIKYMHKGIDGVIPAYKSPEKIEALKAADPKLVIDPKAHIVDMDDKRAGHILNEYAKIGLVQMVFGDDEEVKKAQSIAQYNRFWEHQVEVFNQQNEAQREGGKGFNKPTDLLVKKADEHGLELMKPFTVPKRDDAKVEALKAENVELKETVSNLSGQMKQILDMLKTEKDAKAIETNQAQELTELVAKNRKRYKSLKVSTMSGFIKNNWDEIETMPEENRFEIKSMYEEMYQTPYPAEKPT